MCDGAFGFVLMTVITCGGAWLKGLAARKKFRIRLFRSVLHGSGAAVWNACSAQLSARLCPSA